MGKLIVSVPCQDVQCDEIWGFIQKKKAHQNRGKRRTTASAPAMAAGVTGQVWDLESFISPL